MNRRRFLQVAGGAAGVVGTPMVTAKRDEYAVSRTDVTVKSWDGTDIAATVFEPKAAGEYPAVLATHGWGGSRDQNFGEGRRYAADGYVLLTFDSRGFGASGGEVGVDGPNEWRDVSALLDYLAAHPKVQLDAADDPRVGMFGGSYAGGIQLNAAAWDDRIDAIVPEICWHDLNYSLQPNGVVKTMWGAGLFGVGAGGSRQHEAETGDVRGMRRGMDPKVHRSFAEGVAFNGYSEQSETYFALRSPGDGKLDDIDVPTLLIQGWTDHLFVPNEAIWNMAGLQDAGTKTRLLLYRDGHEQIPVDGTYAQAVSASDVARKAWLDVHLKDDGASTGPAQATLNHLFPGRDDVAFYATQDEAFRSTDGLPPSDAQATTLALGDAANAGGVQGQSVVANGPATSNSYVVTRNWDTRGSSVDFDFPASAFGAGQGERIDVIGPQRLDLRVRPLGSEAFLFVKPKLVAGGTETQINDQVTPLRVTAGPESAGSMQTVSVELLAFQRYLSPGDTLRFTIASADASFNFGRRSAGAVIDHDSTLTVPTRVISE